MFSSEYIKRIVVAIIVLPLFYLYLARLSPLFFLALLIIVAVLAQLEFYSMYKTNKRLSLLGTISGISILCLPLIQPQNFSIQSSAFILVFMLITSVRLFLIKDPSSSMKDISPVFIGFLYIPSLLITQWYLRLKGYEWIILLYGCVWASDSLAYYIGKGFGKKKLYMEVSPNKTLAGAFGSLAGGILSALLLGSMLFKELGAPVLVLIGCTIGIITIIGDLVESMFKRDAGVKDSGTLIPGHGGVLDKIDGSLFAGPVLYWITLNL